MNKAVNRELTESEKRALVDIMNKQAAKRIKAQKKIIARKFKGKKPYDPEQLRNAHARHHV
jgi:cytochrome c556